MVRLSFILLLVLLLCNCSQTSKVVVPNPNGVELSEQTDEDSTEYELIVFDPSFDTYLATLPYPKEFYSNSYYRGWIIQYVAEWNYRHGDPLRYGDFYETYIDYDLNVDYGIDLNFKLYHYFLFIEKEYGITLVKRAKTAR